MEKKTNKAKLEFSKFLKKSAESQGNCAEIVPYLQIHKNTLISVFLHAKIVSALKTVQNPRVFMKNAKRIEK